MRFKTVIPSLLSIGKKYKGWKYNFTFRKSALSQKLGGKYALDSKIIWSSEMTKSLVIVWIQDHLNYWLRAPWPSYDFVFVSPEIHNKSTPKF